MKKKIFVLALALCICTFLTCCDESDKDENNNADISQDLEDDWDEILNGKDDSEKLEDFTDDGSAQDVQTFSQTSESKSDIAEVDTATNEALPQSDILQEKIADQDSVSVTASPYGQELDHSNESDANSNVTVEKNEDAEPKDEIYVWISGSGKKYHSKSDCSNMKSPKKVTKEYAEEKKYTACKKCF